MKNKAFTIIELLVVIVIIGILASVVIVSFSNVSKNATVASLQADLSSASKQIKLYFNEKGSYPTQLICPATLSTDLCIQPSGTNTFTYVANNSSKPSFSLIATNGNVRYQTTDTSAPFSVPSTVTNGLILNLDASNTNSYNPSGPGTTWNDLSGNNNNATLTATTFDSSNSGSLVFNGSTSFGALSVNTIFNLTEITIGVWYKTPSNFGTYYRALLSKQGVDRDYNLYLANLDQGLEVNRFHYSSARLGGNSAIGFTNTLASNSWHYLVLTVNSAGTTVYYSDGVQVATYSSSAGNANSSYPVWIGRADNWYSGNISVVTIHNRALSSSEVTQNFNALRGRYGL